jgi:hypothetical protein
MHIPIPMPVQPSRPPIAPLSPAEILSNRASALYLANVTDDALSLAFEAVAMERTAVTLNNLAVILESHGRFDEALPIARDAYHLAPTDPRLAMLYGEALLRLGELSAGWPLYAAGHERYPWLAPRVPEWTGEPLAGKRLLVLAVGGYGDNIYFLRWLHAFRRDVDVTFLSPPSLAPLVRANIDVRVVENWNGNCDIDLESFDYHAPLNALPWRLGVDFTSPSRVPYLRVRPWSRFHFRRRIGLCWKAGESKSPLRTRTLSWLQQERLRDVLPRRIDLSHLTGDWLDTARLIASLDLVITVDTGVAHLSGALGIPTWVMLPDAHAWHYPAHLDHHPFYPTLRMFRNRGGGLDNAVDAVLEAL